jgi:integrase
MPQLKFTERNIRALPAPDPSGQQQHYWDTEMEGFGVRVSATSNIKSYVVQGTPNGRSRRATIEQVHLISLNDARIRARAMLAAFSAGRDPRTTRFSDITLRQSLQTYLDLNQRMKPRSRTGLQGEIERHLAAWLDRPLRSITREMIEIRHKELAKEIEDRDRAVTQEAAKRHLQRAERTEDTYPDASARHRAKYEAAKKRKPFGGGATANRTMKNLRAIWNFTADRTADFPPCPVRLKQQWFKVKRRGRLVKADDMPAFYKAVVALENPIARDFILTALFTGLRKSEIASLQWRDIDFRNRIIRIAETKANYDVDLPMSDFVAGMLVARRRIGNTGFVFPAASATGRIANTKYYFHQIAAAVGQRYSIHDLRRVFITNAQLSAITPLAVKALVDHSLGTDVTSGYTVLSVQDLREPAQRVTDRLKQLCGIAEPQGENVAKLR